MGICVCSIFTAALTSSLTTLSMETKINLPGTKVFCHSVDKRYSFEIKRMLLFYIIVDKRLLILPQKKLVELSFILCKMYFTTIT